MPCIDKSFDVVRWWFLNQFSSWCIEKRLKRFCDESEYISLKLVAIKIPLLTCLWWFFLLMAEMFSTYLQSYMFSSVCEYVPVHMHKIALDTFHWLHLFSLNSYISKWKKDHMSHAVHFHTHFQLQIALERALPHTISCCLAGK